MFRVMVKQADRWTEVYKSVWMSNCEAVAFEKISYTNVNQTIQRVEIHDHEGSVMNIFDSSWPVFSQYNYFK